MVAGIFIAVPHGMPAVALAVVITTFIHYLMNMYMCTRLIGITWSGLFTALIPSIKLGVAAAILSALLVGITREMHILALIMLLFAAAYVFGVIGMMIFYRPDQLGDSSINILYYLPEKIANNKWIKKMLARLHQ